MWLSQFPCSFYLPVTMYRELTGSCLELTGLYPELTASTCAVFSLHLILSLTFLGDIRSAFHKAMETKRKYVTRSRRSQIADRRSQIADCRSLEDRRSQIADRKSQIADRRSPTTHTSFAMRAARSAHCAARCPHRFSTGDLQSGVCGQGFAMCDRRSAISDRGSAVVDLRSWMCDLRSRSCGL